MYSIKRNALRLGLAAFLGASVMLGCNNQQYPAAQPSISSNKSSEFEYFKSKAGFDKSSYVDGFKIGDRTVAYYSGNPLNLEDTTNSYLKKSIIDSRLINDYLSLTGNSKDDLLDVKLYNSEDLEKYAPKLRVQGYDSLDLSNQSRSLAYSFAKDFFYTDNNSLYLNNDRKNNIEKARREDTDLFIPIVIGNKPYAVGVKIDHDESKADSLESRLKKD